MFIKKYDHNEKLEIGDFIIFSILWGGWIGGGHPQEDLTKFGYISKTKVK